MSYKGSVYRKFRPNDCDYEDKEVRDFVDSYGYNIDDYSHYRVVPKHLDMADASIRRYNRDPCGLSEKVLRLYEQVGNWLDLEFGPFLRDSHVYHAEYIREMLDGTKSPGYPWTLMYPTKQQYWDSKHGNFATTYWNRLATSTPIVSLCSVSIKIELRKTEKVENKEGRTIIAMDVNHVESSCRLFTHQNQRLIRSCNKHASALGMNPLYGGWHKFYCKMNRFGPKTSIEADGKKFDSRYIFHIFKIVYNFRWRMLHKSHQTVENAYRMVNIVYNLVYGLLVNVDGNVFSRQIGNPSGQGNTTPDNSLKNFVDVATLWLLLVAPQYANYDMFKRYLEMADVGDDLLLCVHERLHPYFNPQSMAAAAAEIGMEYEFRYDTFVDLDKTSFLGHNFALCTIPGTGVTMFMPTIECEKMKTSMLIFNQKGTIDNTINRACGLRNETFACSNCREYFASLLSFLKRKYGGSRKPKIISAFKGYLTDSQLWAIYSGLTV